MKKYAYIINDKVYEIIPEKNLIFPDFTLEERYSKEFLDQLIEIPKNLQVEQGWFFNDEDGFFPPPIETIENIENLNEQILENTNE